MPLDRHVPSDIAMAASVNWDYMYYACVIIGLDVCQVHVHVTMQHLHVVIFSNL